MSSLYDANVPGLLLERIPTLTITGFYNQGVCLFDKKNAELFFTFLQNLFAFPHFTEKHHKDPSQALGRAAGSEGHWGASCPWGGGGQATAGGACSTNPQRKRRSGQFSSKHNAFLRLEHQKWLLSIVNTGRWHKAYKPSLELGAERWLGPGAERLRGTKLSRGCGTELRSSDILRTMDSELGQSWNSLGVLLLHLYNGGDHGTSFPARFWGVSAQ